MIELFRMLMQIRQEKRAVTAIEYGIMASLIAIAIIGAVTALGTKLSGTFAKVTGTLAS